MAKIYLSSTYEDLAEHRQAVYRALRQMRHDVLSMEDYGAADERPLDRCLRDVAASDLYVGLIAWRYGFVPPGQHRAITHLEYLEAGRSGRPRLLFLAADDAPWPPNRMDPDPAAILKLRAQLKVDHVVEFFRAPEDLAGAVSVAVANTLARRPDGEARGPAADTEFLRRSLGALTGRLESSIRFYLKVCGGVLGLGVSLLLGGALADNLVLAVGSLPVLGFALPPLATMLSTRRRRDTLSGYSDALRDTHPPPETVRLVQQFLTQQLAT
jgi:hypothetical protein